MRPRFGRILPAMFFIVAVLLGAGAAPDPALAVSGPPDFVIENAFPDESFLAPVHVVFLPDGRRLVVEQGGRVWVVTPAGQKLGTPFIDLSLRTLFNINSGRGLLGVAIDPDFTTNRWVYFAYTVDPDSVGDYEEDAYARIERYQTDATDPNIADLASRQVLIGADWASGLPCPDYYHTIGSLRFGADKTLLLSSGEGAHYSSTDAGGLDPGAFGPGKTNPAEDIGSFRSQSLNGLGGKILRIDKETGNGLPSNPYWDGNPTSPRSRIWVYGLRNPYRFTIQPGTGSTDPTAGNPGTLYIGDTGWNDYESVHVATQGGLNHGWPCREGPSVQPSYAAVSATATGNTHVLCGAAPSSENPAAYTSPPIWWSHTNGANSHPAGWIGGAVIGGAFQVGGNYPAPYAGAYFAVDFIQGWIRWIQMDATHQVSSFGNFVTGADWPVDIECDPVSGDLFYVAQAASQVRRIRYQPVAAPRALAVRADSAAGAGPYPIPGAGSPWVDRVATHDAALQGFDGTAASGWQGAGTVTSPLRLQFDGVNDHVTIPAGSVPELQAPAAATAALWFRTGSDVSTNQSLLEWVSQYKANAKGMRIAVSAGNLRVHLGSWTDVAAVSPGRWYHVAVTKDSASARVYLDGQLAFTSATPNLAAQTSEIVLGASTYRGAGNYGEYWSGAVAQTTIWPSALSTTDVLGVYQSSEALFVPSAAQVVLLRADSANVAAPYPSPGADSPWHDLAGLHDGTLVGFAGDSTSGWQGDGTLAAPHRLLFDGVDDRVTIAAGTVPGLQSATAVSAAVWFRTGADVTTPQYLLEWLAEYAAPYSGMSLMIADGFFRVRFDAWVDAMPVLPNAWYYMTVTKQPGTARIFVNGARRFSGTEPNLGSQLSDLVIGSSTWRGAGVYGDPFKGAIAQVSVWRKALLDPEVQEAFHNDAALYFGSGLDAHVVCLRADSANGATPYPNPGASSPWVDLARDHDATLIGFTGSPTSGWQGDGESMPYHLLFDGIDDCVVIPGGSVPELQQLTETSVSLWFGTGSDVSTKQYLLEWLEQFGAPYPGMTLRVVNGTLNIFLDPSYTIAAIEPLRWYHLAVTKEPGVTRAYLDGQVAYSSASTDLGSQVSEIVVGASTFRGPGIHGDFFRGGVAQMCVWPVALTGAEVLTLFRADSARYSSPYIVDVPAASPTVLFPAQPNPFGGSLTVSFNLARTEPVELAIYGVDGRIVRTLANGPRAAGVQRVTWDGRDAAGRACMPGVYFVRLVTPEGRIARRLVRLR